MTKISKSREVGGSLSLYLVKWLLLHLLRTGIFEMEAPLKWIAIKAEVRHLSGFIPQRSKSDRSNHHLLIEEMGENCNFMVIKEIQIKQQYFAYIFKKTRMTDNIQCLARCRNSFYVNFFKLFYYYFLYMLLFSH